MDKESVKADKTYGTSRANAYRLMEDCLNLKQTKIFDYEYLSLYSTGDKYPSFFFIVG